MDIPKDKRVEEEIELDTLRELLPKEVFDKERDLKKYLERNIEKFSKSVLGSELEEYERECYLGNIMGGAFNLKINYGQKVKSEKFTGNKPRIDFYLELKDGRKIGIEIKNPTNVYSELILRGITQLMMYSVIAKENGNELDESILITSKFDSRIVKILREYNLPFKVIVLTKEFTAELIN